MEPFHCRWIEVERRRVDAWTEQQNCGLWCLMEIRKESVDSTILAQLPGSEWVLGFVLHLNNHVTPLQSEGNKDLNPDSFIHFSVIILKISLSSVHMLKCELFCCRQPKDLLIFVLNESSKRHFRLSL